MKKNIFILLLILTAMRSSGQSCAYCNKTPKVSNYDYNVQVPEPAEKGDAYLKWQSLFWISKFANAKLLELNRNCVRFIQPLVHTSYGEGLSVALTKPMLPEQSSPSKYCDYLITGTITASGEGYQLHIELQTACWRAQVAAVTIPFTSSPNPADLKAIAEGAAAQLSPLIEKINEFASQQRETNMEVAYANWSAESITIVPKRKNLGAGEETEVQISIKDCDGYALGNRVVDFTKTSLNGMPILGTTGGTVTPNTVTTDADGKAKVKFKMGTGKTAMIAAHYLFDRPSGCSDAMVGSCPINGVPVKLLVEYEIGSDISFEPKLDLGAVKSIGGEEHSYFSRSYTAVIYHYPSKTPENLLLFISPKDKMGTNNQYVLEDGYFHYLKEKKERLTEVYMGNERILEEQNEGQSSESNFGRVRAGHSTSFAFYKKTALDPISFNIEFDFENEGDESEIGAGGFPSGISVSEGDPHVTIRTIKIDDDKSPYKTEYIIDMDRDVWDIDGTDKMLGTSFKSMFQDMNYKNSGRERLRLCVLTPF